jgi:hypothetical protein
MDLGIRLRGSVLVVCRGKSRPKSSGVGSFGGAAYSSLKVLFKLSINAIQSAPAIEGGLDLICGWHQALRPAQVKCLLV